MNISLDPRCDVHLMLLGMREGKESWLELYSPTNKDCDDEGLFWSSMVSGSVVKTGGRKRDQQQQQRAINEPAAAAARQITAPR